MKRLVCFSLVMLGVVGCKDPELVQLSPGVYLLTDEDKGGAFGNTAKMKANVIRRANEFATSQGKVAIPVTTHETPMAFGHFATFEYQFRLVDKDSPEARGLNTLGPMPTVSIQKIETTDSTQKSKDLYTELMKLDDLRKKGIINEEEFQAEKRKLLAGN